MTPQLGCHSPLVVYAGDRIDDRWKQLPGLDHAVISGLVLARGQGDLVLEAVKTARKNHRGRDGGRGASAEWSQTDCQPCVSLV